MNFRKIIALTLIIASTQVFGQKSFDAAAKLEVVNEISKRLKDHYIFEELAVSASDLIQTQLKAGKYNQISNQSAFANQITEDLRSLLHDKHVRVRYRAMAEGKKTVEESPLLFSLKSDMKMKSFNQGFTAVSVLDGNVGYLEVSSFAQVETMRETADHALALLENVDALVLDLRKNNGGDLNAVQYLCSYFLKPGIHINSIFWRDGKSKDFITLAELPGKRLHDVPIFVLTSKRTHSAGEECAYDLQTQKRAILIGETTGGAANPGGDHDVSHGFEIFVPDGRALNPVTGKNWEGVGVVPEIAVSAEEAYDLGVKKAQEAAEARRNGIVEKAERYFSTLQPELKKAVTNVKSQGIEAAFKPLAALFESCYAESLLSEEQVNNQAYGLMEKGEKEFAALLLLANTKQFPNSANVYDSYGDALDLLGMTEAAIRSYAKAVELGEAEHSRFLDNFKANLNRAQKKLKM